MDILVELPTSVFTQIIFNIIYRAYFLNLESLLMWIIICQFVFFLNFMIRRGVTNYSSFIIYQNLTSCSEIKNSVAKMDAIFLFVSTGDCYLCFISTPRNSRMCDHRTKQSHVSRFHSSERTPPQSAGLV